jgi:hypothetical protein
MSERAAKLAEAFDKAIEQGNYTDAEIRIALQIIVELYKAKAYKE